MPGAAHRGGTVLVERTTSAGGDSAPRNAYRRARGSWNRSSGRSELPGAPAQHRDLLARVGDAGHRDVVAADHEVHVDLGLVEPLRVVAVDREAVGLAERDMAGGVLVEQ